MYYKDFIEDYIDFFGLQKINSVSELKEQYIPLTYINKVRHELDYSNKPIQKLFLKNHQID